MTDQRSRLDGAGDGMTLLLAVPRIHCFHICVTMWGWGFQICVPDLGREREAWLEEGLWRGCWSVRGGREATRCGISWRRQAFLPYLLLRKAPEEPGTTALPTARLRAPFLPP